MSTKWFAPLVTIAACGVLLTGGSAAVAAAPAVPVRASAPAVHGSSTVRAHSGRVRFSAYQDNDQPGASLVLSGAIGDFGEAVSVLPNRTVDPEHSSQEKLLMTQGSFRILIGPLDKKFLNATGHSPFSRVTCSGNATVTGTAPVVAGSGTGAYRGIRGSFTLTVMGNEVFAPGCQRFTGALLAESLFIGGSGTITYSVRGR